MTMFELHRASKRTAVFVYPFLTGFVLPTLFAIVLALTPGRLFAAQFYDDWAASHFSDIPGQSGVSDDPDQDGEGTLWNLPSARMLSRSAAATISFTAW
jgi:hypothetical protein